MTSKKKRRGRGKNITSALDLLGREPYRTIIEIIYLFGEAEPRQIIYVCNNENEKELILQNAELTRPEMYQRLWRINGYRNSEVKQLIHSRPENPPLHPLNSDNLKKFLNTLIKCGIIERKGRGKYQIAWAFEKEFARESDKNIINRYPGSEITDKAREYGITLYGVEHLKKRLEKADIREFAVSGLKHLKGEDYLEDISEKLSDILDNLWQLGDDIKTVQNYLVTVFLTKQLNQQSKTIKDFFIKHNWEELANFALIAFLTVISSSSDPHRFTKYLSPEEGRIVKDYMGLNEEERNVVKKIVNECWEEYHKVNASFSLFYSDIKYSPSPLTLEGGLQESRIDAIMNDNTLNFEERVQRRNGVFKEQYPDEFADAEAHIEETKPQEQEWQEKSNEIGKKYGNDVPLGNTPEGREIIKKQLEELLEKGLMERKKREEKG